jgi:predicted nucleic acid-binding Zn ribbon protein
MTVRYGWRDGSAVPTAPDRGCPTCGRPLPSRRARFCSTACKQRAYRLRQLDTASSDIAALAAELKRRSDLVAHTVYECPACQTRYLGDQRCGECNRFSRALGPGGLCQDCDAPVLIADLLR